MNGEQALYDFVVVEPTCRGARVAAVKDDLIVSQ